MQDIIKHNLISLNPSVLIIENESHLHHLGKGANTHFKLIVVSKSFNNKSRVLRHQMVYQLLSEQIKQEIHALSLKLFTPKEWNESDLDLESAPCLGKGL